MRLAPEDYGPIMNDAPPPANVLTLTLTLDRNEWNIVLAGLGELPVKIAYNVFRKVLVKVQPENAQ